MVTLSGPVEISSTIDVVNDLTINLNGQTITYIGENTMFNVKNSATLTINDKANDNIPENDDDETDDSAVVSSKACVATANNGNVVINGGRYDVSSTSGIITKDSKGSVVVNKGLFLEWNPEQLEFMSKGRRCVIKQLNARNYYNVDKIIESLDITNSSTVIKDLENALLNPFVDTLVISTDISNPGITFYINHDIVIDGSNSSSITAGGFGKAYGFEIMGPQKVEIKNIDIIGSISGYPQVNDAGTNFVDTNGPEILIENCSITPTYKESGRHAIAANYSTITIISCNITVGSKVEGTTTASGTNYISVGGCDVTIGTKNIPGYREGKFSGVNYPKYPGLKGNTINITGGKYDVDPSAFVDLTKYVVNTVNESNKNWYIVSAL